MWVMHEHPFRARIPLTTLDVQETAGSMGHHFHWVKPACRTSVYLPQVQSLLLVSWLAAPIAGSRACALYDAQQLCPAHPVPWVCFLYIKVQHLVKTSCCPLQG